MCQTLRMPACIQIAETVVGPEDQTKKSTEFLRQLSVAELAERQVRES
jgi:hypothetical protein